MKPEEREQLRQAINHLETIKAKFAARTDELAYAVYEQADKAVKRIRSVLDIPAAL